ncbi:MAG: O-antigen ligase family protein [Phycisphaerales bacterium]|nr:O-antigen ligase family protein [Phycisphaerales bacterium]
MPAGTGPPTTLRAAVALARSADPLGHRVHVALAGAFAFVLPLGMVPIAKDVILIALAVYTLLRLPKIHRCFHPFWRDPLTWLILAWPAWFGLSLLWSPSPAFGVEESRVLRMLLLLPLLWPVLGHYHVIIGAFVMGCGVIVLFQLGQVLGLPGFTVDIQGRADAAMQPILAGAFLVTAATWLLSGVLHWRGRRGAAIAAGLIVIVVGLVLTGSRGPWVSLAIAGTLLVLTTVLLVPPARRRVAALGGLATVAVAGVVLLDIVLLSGQFTNPIRARVETALVETDASAGDAHYEMELGGWHRTPVGYRLLVWEAATQVFRANPIIGTGGGGLSSELDASWWLSPPEAAAAGIPVSQQHLNPHSMYLQVLASTGVIGLLLLVIPMVMAWCRLLGRAGDPVLLGAAFVLVAWASGAAFDGYQMMTSMMAVLMLIYLAAMIARQPTRGETT